jgi:hypothetical protein
MADQAAAANWQRYEYGRTRGHRDYCAQARRCERFFLGGGEQWDEADLAILKSQGRPAYEFNEVMPSINAAVGYQIHNRMDISFKPRGGNADQIQAEIRSKIAMQIADDNKLHWLETQVFGDGIIQQRGYFDIRMDFADNLQGDITVSTLDPLDVIPDPDAKSYDPDDWADVTVTRWLTHDDVEQQFGKDKRIEVENFKADDADFGDDGDSEPRNKFGDVNSGAAYDSQYSDAQVRRVRVIDRQRWVYTLTKVGVWPETGDVRVIEDESPEALAEMQAKGVIITKRMQKRIKWTVSTYDITLHDDWSPYKHFTIVPYFAYFRRGKTRGMIDNAIGPQEALNKAVSQFVHIINTSANSGWVVEENSLTNMEVSDLETVGAKTGLVLEHKQGSAAPQKIQPNAVPTGVDRLIDRATNALKDATVPEAMRGINSPEVSGIAIQSKQFASQQQMATPLDNLAHTRHLLAVRMLDLMHQFYTAQRVFRITETNPMTGKPETKELAINEHDPVTGSYTNDMTEGEYDVVISEQPLAATFEDTQFQQALELRKAGVPVPDDVVIRHSNLTDKADILSRMDGQKQADPLAEAKAALIAAQTEKVKAEVGDVNNAAIKKSIEAMFSAMQAAEVIATTPQTAPIADELMAAGGYQHPTPGGVDPNFPQPGVLSPVAGGLPTGADSTTLEPRPLTHPATPGVGKQRGIETQRADSGMPKIADGVPGFANGGMIGEEEPDEQDGLTSTQRIGIQGLTQRAEEGQIGNSIKLPAGLSPSQQGSALIDMSRAAPTGTDPDLLNGLRDAASAVANPGYEDNGAFGSAFKTFGGGDDILRRFANGGMIGNTYDTQLSPDDEQQFQQWATQTSQKMGRDVMMDTEDYDLRGLYKGQGGFGENGHAPDTFKKPNHPTFSDQSQYHGQNGMQGGAWDQVDGKDRFTPGPTNLQNWKPDQLRDYFNRAEPNVILNIQGYANGGQVGRYMGGGQIVGPGTGTSDSVPAVVDGQEPIKVSAGEFIVPADVVAALGPDFFESLIMKFHTPTDGDSSAAG